MATNALFMAIEKAGTVTDKEKIITALEGMKYELTKGPEYVRCLRPSEGSELSSSERKRKKAKDWDLADLVAEIPGESIIMSCEDNAKKLPFINVKLP